MIEANNPAVDVAALERRIEVELRQPERLNIPPLAASSGVTSVYRTPRWLALKLRLRAIPVLGSILAALNRWRRRHRLIPRLLAIPYAGYAFRWVKSLMLVHETRGQLHQTRDRVEQVLREASFVEQRLSDRLSVLRTEVGLTEQRLSDRLSVLRTEAGLTEQRLAALREEVAEEKKLIAANRSDIIFQQRRLTRLQEQGVTPTPVADTASVAVKVRSDALDSFYAAFEASFRGTEAEIKDRKRVYLDRVEFSVKQGLPVLDIGCGRGEWIELLAEQGIAAYGIDMNSVFVADAQLCNLDIREAEALAHLRSLPDASLAGLTGFHIIEHLELNDLINIIDEANRVLAPGGFLLFETPNPENLIVGSNSFWADPTHRAPVPPSVSRFMVEHRGFVDTEIIYLHPDDDAEHLEGADPVASLLNRLLYGARDYAILARKA